MGRRRAEPESALRPVHGPAVGRGSAPEASPEQKLATGFLRNNRVNGEGGSIADEFRVEYAVDRVNTVSTAWMGLTVGCARCHDHKYDPISQSEFYRLFAFFNNVSEPGTYRRSAAPTIKVPPRVVQRQLERIHRQLQILDRGSSAYATLETQHRRLWEQVPVTMIMRDDEARETFVLGRGQYDLPGAKVTPGVPKVLPPLAPGDPPNRLMLARWLVDTSHPLTARVAANRLWQLHFGSGLVTTPEDFGVQGEPPTHPLLLDWLASELLRLKWDVKAFQRMIVTSATYLESSKLTPALLQKDPGQPSAGAGSPVASARRDDSGSGPGGQRAAGRVGRRAVGQAVSAGRPSGTRSPAERPAPTRKATSRGPATISTAAASTRSGGAPFILPGWRCSMLRAGRSVRPGASGPTRPSRR